jgi:uncharacterized small protein (DUF1192 family)
MHNYKALKSASKVSVQKVKVVDQAADEDAGIKERSHEELQVVCKCYDAQTGEAKDDSVRAYSLAHLEFKIDQCKSQVARLEAEQAEWEQLETDLKAL